jgi:hypothetical protein
MVHREIIHVVNVDGGRSESMMARKSLVGYMMGWWVRSRWSAVSSVSVDGSSGWSGFSGAVRARFWGDSSM